MKKLLFAGLLVTSAAVLATDEPFNVTMTLLAPIVITENSALVFPASQSGAVLNVVVATGDAGAADFSATGTGSSSFTKSVVETSITMTTGDGVGSTKQIVVDSWSLAGPSAFTAGSATGLKVGATAHILVEDIPGDYAGVANFRIVY